MKFNTHSPTSAALYATSHNEAWAIDFAMLDFAAKPLVMLVVDVRTRRPLSATVSHMAMEDIIIRLERLVRRSGRPERIWMDYSSAYNTIEGHFHPSLQAWAQKHRISLTHDRMLLTRRISERPLRDLSASLREKSFTTLMELGHDIERWRQSYHRVARTMPNVNQ